MAEHHNDGITDTTDRPQFRIRVNTGRNSAGVTFDATAEMSWTGDADTYRCDGQDYPVEVALARLRQQVHIAVEDRVADAKRVDTYVPKPGKE